MKYWPYILAAAGYAYLRTKRKPKQPAPSFQPSTVFEESTVPPDLDGWEMGELRKAVHDARAEGRHDD